MELIEYCNGKSPYTDISLDNSYYAGPSNYYESEGQFVKNINTGEKNDKSALSHNARKVKEKIKGHRQERRKKSKTENVVPNSELLVAGDPGPTGSDIIDADDYSFYNRHYMTNYEFFLEDEQLIRGHNTGMTCGSVAAQLLLGYNNWANDGRLIPEISPTGVRLLPLGQNSDEMRAKPYDAIRRSTTSEINDNGQIDSFYELLIQYIDPAENGATTVDVANGIELYLEKCVPSIKDDFVISHSMLEVGAFDDYYVEQLKDSINNGNPAIAGIIMFNEKDNKEYEKIGHFVVVYGYQMVVYEGQEIEGFIANFGWDANYSHVWFNSDWVDSYITIETTHEHIDQPLKMDEESQTEEGVHISECTICHRTAADWRHTTFAYEELQKDIGDDYVRSKHHIESCSCGYEMLRPHFFDYENYQSLGDEFHIKTCNCGYQVIEEHSWRMYSCFFCSQSGARAE